VTDDDLARIGPSGQPGAGDHAATGDEASRDGSRTTGTHTPGPWSRELNSRGQWEVFALSQALICRLAKWTPPIDEADARLITAAPDLLQFGKAAYHALESYAHGNASPELARACALALKLAIAKAEGR